MKVKPHRPYELKEYDPQWKTKFKEISKIIKKLLYKEVIAIHHVGSTSIPGMVAKPQIDILVVVKDVKKIKEYNNQIIAKGFIYLKNYVNGKDCFAIDNKDGKRLATIHIVQEGSQEISNQLAFREYLKNYKGVIKEYSDLKKILYKKYKNDYSSYGPGKRDFIISTLKKARKWAKDNRINT
ncbi:MAG: GrpB family protein [Nanoarchaeota archaeon]